MRAAAREARGSTPFRFFARTGQVVLGILHILIGAIAISVASGGRGAADQDGALQQIQNAPAGVFLLWIIAVGLFALALWKVAGAVLARDPESPKQWGVRIRFAGTAIAYLAIAGTALVYALGGHSNSAAASRSLSAGLLTTLIGGWLLVLIGLVAAGIGIGFIVSGVTRSFTKYLGLPRGAARSGIVTFGVIGYVAKGISVGVTGVLFVVAAFTRNPQAAGGMDAALRSLVGLPYGPVILWTVGVGLVLYGLFCFARARSATM